MDHARSFLVHTHGQEYQGLANRNVVRGSHACAFQKRASGRRIFCPWHRHIARARTDPGLRQAFPVVCGRLSSGNFGFDGGKAAGTDDGQPLLRQGRLLTR